MSDTSPAKTFSRYPLVWLSVYLAAGIALGHQYRPNIFVPLAIVAGLMAAFAIRRSLLPILVPLVFLPLGIFIHHAQFENISDSRVRRIYDEGRIKSGSPVELEAKIISAPEIAPDGSFLRVRVERIATPVEVLAASGVVQLFIPRSTGLSDMRSGARIRVSCSLLREEQFQNPGVASRVELLDQQGIDATATIKKHDQISVVEPPASVSVLDTIYSLREHLISEFRTRFSAPTAGVLVASLLGDKHFLDRRTSDVFRDGGTFHVLVISGLHVTFIGGLLLLILSVFTRHLWIQFFIVSGFLWLFTLAVGGDVPVVRASLMFTIMLFARAIHRSESLLNAFGFSVMILLVWRPADLFTASFQLTVASVGSIVGCAFPLIEKLRAIGSWMPSAQTPLPPHASGSTKRFCEMLYWNEDRWRLESGRQIWSANLFKMPYLERLARPGFQTVLSHLFEGILVTVIVQAWMLPLVVIYFHRVSPAAVMLNLWVGLFLAIETFAALIGIAIGLVSSWLAAPFLFITEAANSLMMSLPEWLTTAGIAGYRLPAYTGFGAAIYFAYFAAILFASHRIFRWRPFDLVASRQGKSHCGTSLSIWLTIALAAVIMLHPFTAPSPDGRLTVDFIDVGQGDSALVTFPDGETMLIDGGGHPDFGGDPGGGEAPDKFRIGESVVSEFLWEKGYSSIDYLVATHADSDHIQGLADVARNFTIGRAFVGSTEAAGYDAREFFDEVRRRGIEVDVVAKGDRLSIGGAAVEISNPGAGAPPLSTNNSSVVLRIRFGDRSFLFTGDIERETEAQLVGDASIDLHADVVKVPHHGSRTSSTQPFVDRIAASTAVISVGRRSVFGHPRPEVVDRWRNAGAAVMTTGENGTITISTDGSDLRVSTFLR